MLLFLVVSPPYGEERYTRRKKKKQKKKSFGVEQIVHTRWPAEIFAHACVEIKPISIPFMCIPSRNKA